MIRIEGRNLADEGFSGANARDMDTGRMSKEAALFLTETIKKAIAPINNTVKTNKVVIAQTASNMAKIIEQNTKEFQTIIQDSGEDTQQELVKLLSMMNDAQKKTGDASIAAMKDVVQQIENLKRSDTTGKLSPLLDLDRRQKEITKPLGRQTVFGAAFKKLTNVDLRRESALQALSPTKLFGLDPGSGDIIKEARTNAATFGATSSLSKVVGALTPNSDSSSQRASSVLSQIKTTPTTEKNAEGGRIFTTGIDRESLDNKQVELLEQILAQLKKMESFNPLDGLAAAIGTAVATAVLPLTVIVGGISAIVWTIKNLAELDYVEKTATPILESRNDMYLSGIGFSPDQVRQRNARANSPLQRAKDSGLYDKDFAGNSEIDLNILSATTDSSVLKSILNDNDINDLDRIRVERRLGQIEREQIDTAPIIGTGVLSSSTQETLKSTSKNTSYMMDRMFPVSIGTQENKEAPLLNLLTPEITRTGDAVLNMTETASPSSSEQGTTVINNITNNNYSTRGSESTPIVVSPTSATNSRTDSLIER